MIHYDGRKEIAQENSGFLTSEGSARRALSSQGNVKPHRQRGMSVFSRGATDYAARREYDFKNPPSRVVQITWLNLKLTAGAGALSHAADKGSDAEDRDEYLAENVFWVPKGAR